MGAYGVRVAVLVAVLGGAGVWSSASAQEPPPAGTMGIWFPDPADVGAGFMLEEFLGGSIAVFADGTLCGSFAIVQPTLIVVGAADQPGACRVEGAHISFANGRGHMNSVTSRFEMDTTVSFDNFAPWAPHTPYPGYACDYFDSVGIESVSCQMTGPPGVAPGGVGNAGLTYPTDEAARARQAVLLALTLVLVAGARRSSRHLER